MKLSKILVTGGSMGLGSEICAALLRAGHTVYNYDLENGHDVLSPEVASFEKLDVLVNCAGVNRINWLENVTEDDWDTVMGVNAKGIYKMPQACLPLLVKSKGTILNIISNAA